MPDPWLIAANQLDPPAWQPEGRPPLLPHQIPPDGDWDLWMLFGGRGSGKTEGCSRYYARYMRANPYTRGRIIGPTLGDVVESCVEDPESGLLSIDPDIRFVPSAVGGASLFWPNGSRARLIGIPTKRDVERLRAAGNSHIDWWEEMAAIVELPDAWDQAEFGLRSGAHPHSIASTTPRNVPKIRELLKDPRTRITSGSIHDNPHLSDVRRQRLVDKYAGTRLGEQELLGKLLDDVEGALWKWAMLEHAYADWLAAVEAFGGQAPPTRRVVIGVDPNASEQGAECGVIAAGLLADARRGVVLDDYSVGQASPDKWGRAVVNAYWDHKADRVVAEVNNGGDMVAHVIRTIDPRVPVKSVRATRGKVLRAEPVVALYEQRRILHAQRLPLLEGQQTTWTQDQDSPDRLDALVWAVTELFGLGEEQASPIRAH